MTDPFAEKAAFFDQLFALNESSDDDDDGGDVVATNNSSLSRASSSFSESIPQNKIHTPQTFVRNSSLSRTFSAPTPTSVGTSIIKDTPVPARHSLLQQVNTTTPLASEVSIVKETPITLDSLAMPKGTPRRTNSAPISSATLNTPFQVLPTIGLGKRKRQDSKIQLKPEAQQYFKNLSFMYIPNDDKDPRRRLRIMKARQHGAAWIRAWDSSITHIIVDKMLTYNDIIKYLKIPSIPANVIMVDEIYPIECIQYRCIVDHKQKQYSVRGHQQALDGEAKSTTTLTTSEISDQSLALKSAQSKREIGNYNPPRSTRSRRKESRPDTKELTPQAVSDNLPPNISSDQPRDMNAALEEHVVKETECEYSNMSQEDVLDEIIKQERKTAHLPLDDDDDDERPPSHNESDSDISENERGSLGRNSLASFEKASKKSSFNQENFSCMTGGTGASSSSNPNHQTISILQEMADYYTRINDTWRPIAYRRAITTLRAQKKKIVSSSQAKELKFIGNRLASKIEEIVLTNRLRRLEHAKSDPSDIILGKFMQIYGVGASQASRWVAQGHRTLEDLLQNVNLTGSQRLGMAHYDHFQCRIPRDEVSALGTIVKHALATIDGQVEGIIGGSYRRGASSSGDIDFILTKPGTHSSTDLLPILKELVASLTDCGFLVAALAVPRSERGSKWHGCCVLPGVPTWRRIDFLVVPASELGAALIYFTGNDIFNRSIRLLASRKGLRLNQRGLYKNVMRGPGRAKVNDGELVEGADERRIFEVLCVPWRAPENRIC